MYFNVIVVTSQKQPTWFLLIHPLSVGSPRQHHTIWHSVGWLKKQKWEKTWLNTTLTPLISFVQESEEEGGIQKLKKGFKTSVCSTWGPVSIKIWQYPILAQECCQKKKGSGRMRTRGKAERKTPSLAPSIRPPASEGTKSYQNQGVRPVTRGC